MKLTAKQYGTSLYKVLNAKGHESSRKILREFAELLYERGETGKLGEISRYFEETMLREEGKVKVSVVSAHGVSQLLPHKILNRLPQEEHREDKKMIAGVRVRIADTLIDTTIARKLDNLKKALS